MIYIYFYFQQWEIYSGFCIKPPISGVERRLRACLHGGGAPQVAEVTRLGGVTRLSI